MQARGDVRVAYVWDHDISRANHWAKELDAEPIENRDRALDDAGVSGVIVCSETNRHEALVLPAVSVKKHLFVEKPLGIGSQDALRMAEAIENAGILFQTGYFQRGNRAADAKAWIAPSA